MEKFLYCGSVERVPYLGSMDNYADPLLGIKLHNDSYAVETWRSSYIVELWKGAYSVEAKKIVLIRYWVLSTIIDSYAVVAWSSSYIGEVWKRSHAR